MVKMFGQSYNKKATGDRFIPRRAREDFNISNILLTASTKVDTSYKDSYEHPRYINYAYINYKRKIYKERLWSTIIPTPCKILNFSEPKRTKAGQQNKVCEFPVNQLWPVKPRKMPLITAPTMVLDMPDLKTNYCHHITDWGQKGYLASVYEKEVYLWDPVTNVPRILSSTGGIVENCVKWNKTGTHFAMALMYQGIAVWDLESSKVIHENLCYCPKKCTVTSIDWSTDGTHIATGCTNGRLCIWSSALLYICNVFSAHEGPIIAIAFSSGNNYVATSGFEGSVRVWHWPLRPNFEIKNFAPVKGLAWHPWRDSLLAVGSSLGGLTLWNVSSTLQLRSFLKTDMSCDTLTWSEITGELVVSFWDRKANENTICILSNFECAVDAIEWHEGRVPYLLWGPGGTQLATAGTDENLCVWDFLGSSKNNKIKKKKTAESINFGKCIR